MKKVILSVLLLASFCAAQSYYYGGNQFGQTSPGAMKYGLYGHDNPALLSTMKGFDLLIGWTNFNTSWDNRREIAAFAGAEGFGFSVVNSKNFNLSNYHYRVASGFGNKMFGVGYSYAWSSGDVLGRLPVMWSLGGFYRPFPFLNIGMVTYLPREGEEEYAIEGAVRPMSNEKISLFADYVQKEKRSPNEAKWSGGIAIEALPGFRITGRYFDNKTATIGVQLELGATGLSSQTYLDKDNKYAFQTYGVRVGAYDRNFLSNFSKGKYLYSMELSSGLDYSRFKLFDTRATLMELMKNIDAAECDPKVSGIIINATTLNGNPELFWEVREKLVQFKKSGKQVIVYLERADLADYHFASVADKIVLDPLGQIVLPGYLMGRSYLKGTLDKLGIGFDEFRFFKYKSAVETFSRDKMSEADREQRQKIVDDWYALAKKEITESGRMDAVKFDSLVNEQMIFLAEECVKFKLVDTVARWSDFVDTLQKEKKFVIGQKLEKNMLPEDNYWGEKPQIAVIYALGACDMETGIAARSLVKDVKAAVENPDVKAIVLRVDSPGGDALASDYIAAQLLKAKGKKPVIVSQGFVAGSGGYWLSMYGDTIVAAPSTITGSIGVIGGWFYNKSFKEMLGVSTDYVKRGNHADMGFGFVVPILNLPIADRAPSTEERAKVEYLIRTMYAEFVQKVADGRKMKFDQIEAIAQGRVWSGYDGKKIGLVDELGGLQTALNIAESKAGLKKGGYTIVEYPAQKLFDFSVLTPKLFGVTDPAKDPVIEKLRYRISQSGKPLYMVPMDFEIEP